MVSACVISIRAINRLVILSGFWTHQNKDGLHQWTPPPYAHPSAPFSVMPIHSGLNSLLCLLCLNHEMKDLGQFSHESGHTDLTGAVSCPGYASFVDKHETGIMVQFGWFVFWVDCFCCEKIQVAGRWSVIKNIDFSIHVNSEYLKQFQYSFSTILICVALCLSEWSVAIFFHKSSSWSGVFSISVHSKCSKLQM